MTLENITADLNDKVVITEAETQVQDTNPDQPAASAAKKNKKKKTSAAAASGNNHTSNYSHTVRLLFVPLRCDFFDQI
jgi:hypothetical protein